MTGADVFTIGVFFAFLVLAFMSNRSARRARPKSAVRRLLIIAVLLCVAPLASANPVAHVWHFAGHHKELIAVDVLEAASYSADAASTRYAERKCLGCVEANPWISPRPSAHEVWGVAGGYTFSLAAVNGLLWHYSRGEYKSDRHLVWFVAVPVLVNEGVFVIPNNVRAAQ